MAFHLDVCVHMARDMLKVHAHGSYIMYCQHFLATQAYTWVIHTPSLEDRPTLITWADCRHHHHRHSTYIFYIYSTVYRVPPAAGRVRPQAITHQSRQISLPPAKDNTTSVTALQSTTLSQHLFRFSIHICCRRPVLVQELANIILLNYPTIF